MKSDSKVVLITGCSSGIGRSTALELQKAGHTVVATARKVDAIADLKAAGCHTLALDVTDEGSMTAAVSEVERSHGRVDVLINNAGYSQSGAVESVPVDRMRAQFETNVWGAIRLAQLVLPGMRSRGSGKVINVSSMGGKLTLPGGGVYHASKYALEALSDALRWEVRGFGVDVVLIEPGLIKTGFSGAAVNAMAPVQTDGVYQAFNARVAHSTVEAYEKGPLAKLGGTPEDVAKVIAKAISAKRPKARYTVTASAKMLIAQRALMSDGVWDAFLRTQMPEPQALAQALQKAPKA